MSFTAHLPLGAATGVVAAAWARLLEGVPETHLVTARGEHIDCYALRRAACCPPPASSSSSLSLPSASPPALSRDAGQDDAKQSVRHSGVGAQLQLVATAHVAARIESICAVRLTGSAAASVTGRRGGVNALLVTAKHAKASLLALDPFTMRLKTLAMLNFGADATGPGSWVRGEATATQPSGLAALSVAIADPDSRVAAMMVYDDQLAVLPLRRAVEGLEDVEDADFGTDEALAVPASRREGSDDAGPRGENAPLPAGDSAADGSSDAAAQAVAAMDAQTRAVFRRPYIVDTASLGPAGLAGSVRDAAFLHGYNVEPALALLVARGVTSAARLASLSHTCTLAAVSIDVHTRLSPVLWQHDGLPHDSFAVIPVPQPVGGAMVLTVNALLYFNQQRYCGLALNAFAAATVDVRGKFKLDTNVTHDRAMPAVCIAIDGARAAFLDPTHMLLTLRDGAQYVARLHLSVAGDVQHLTILPAGIRGPQTTHMALLPASPLLAMQLVPASASAPSLSWRFGLLFQGSHVADSLLSLFALDAAAGGGSSGAPFEGASGRAFAAAGGAGGGAGAAMAMEDDDAFLYGAGDGEAATAASAPPPAAASFSATPASIQLAAGTTSMSIDDEDAFLYGAAAGADEAAPRSTGSAASDAAVLAASGSDSATALAPEPAAEAAGASGPASLRPAAAAAAGPLLQLLPVDSLPNAGPIADAAIGRCGQLPTDDTAQLPVAVPPTEVVAVAGAGHTGALCIMQRGIRPFVVTELPMAGIVGAWHVAFSAPDNPSAGFLVLSSERATRVLATGDGLAEVAAAQVEFLLTDRTLALGALLLPGALIDQQDDADRPPSHPGTAADVLMAPPRQTAHDGTNCRIVQVHDGGVRVLAASTEAAAIQELDKDLPADVGGLGAPPGVSIVYADTCDPYLLLRLSDGSLRVLCADADGDLVAVAAELLEHAGGEMRPYSSDPVTAACLFRDDVAGQLAAGVVPGAPAGQRAFLAATRRSGLLSLYHLPTCVEVFTFHGIHVGPQVLTNHFHLLAAKRRGGGVTSREGRVAMTAAAGGVALSPTAAASVVDAAEPCEDTVMENVAPPDATQEGERDALRRGTGKHPRTYVRELVIVSSPQPALVALNSLDDVYVYQLSPALQPRAGVEASLGGAANPWADGDWAAGLHGVDAARLTAAHHSAHAPATLQQPPPDQKSQPSNGRKRSRPATNVPTTSTTDLLLAPNDINAQARFVDANAQLQYTRAAAAGRFLRVPQAIVTRFVEPALVGTGPLAASAAAQATAARDAALELAFRRYTPRRLVPFSDISGWSGIAVLTPLPVWLLSHRGMLTAVPMSLPDMSGAAGSSALPGDLLFGPSPVAALVPFSSPECDRGFVYAHQGFIQFALLPRPSWPSTCVAADSHRDAGAATMPLIAAGAVLQQLSGAPALPAAVEAVLTISSAPEDEAEHRAAASLGLAPACVVAQLPPFWQQGDDDAAMADGGQAAVGSGGDSDAAAAAAAAAATVAGRYYINYDTAAPLLLSAGGDAAPCLPFFKQYLQVTARHIAYLEQISAAAGAAAVSGWLQRRAEAAAGAQLQPPPPPPPPPSAAQQAACIVALYAVSVAVPRQRDYAVELADFAALIKSEGGEYAQVDYGPHEELIDPPLRMTGADPAADALAHAFTAAGLTAPPAPDSEDQLCLYYGSDAAAGVAGGWRVAAVFALQHGEQVLTVREVPLVVYDSSRPASAPQLIEPHLVVGTGIIGPRGEDAPARGRVLVFRVLPDPASASPHPATGVGFKLSLVAEKDMGAPVSVVAPLAAGDRRHVLVALPRALQVWTLSEGKLKMLRPNDANVFVRDVAVLGKYVLFGDTYRSVRFLEWREDDRSLISLARDANPLNVAAVEMLAFETTLGLVAADEDGNLVIYAYAPRDAQNWLVPRGDFHTGAPLARLLRSRCAVPPATPPAARRRFVLLAPALDGSLSALVPLDELTFKRLHALQVLMSYTSVQTGGFSPKEWRAFAPAGGMARVHRARIGNVLDGALLWTLTSLDLRLQKALAEAIGSTLERLLDNLRSLDLAATVF